MLRALLVSASILLISTQSPAISEQAVYRDIVRLKPAISPFLARTLASHIARFSRMFGTDPRISVAIAMQESSLVNKNRTGLVRDIFGRLRPGISDFGVFQLHVETLRNLGREGWEIDVRQLAHDLEYQTYLHILILKRKIRTCENRRERLAVQAGTEWACYHSFTPKVRSHYVRSVSTHLAKLN